MSSPPTFSPRDGAADVLAAGRLLADMLESAPGSASLAVDRLAAASEAAEAGFSGYVQSRFAAVEKFRATDAGTAAAEASDDVLLAVIAEVDMGNVLLAAAQAVGETGASDPSQLAPALDRLASTTDRVEAVADGHRRFGWSAETAEPPLPSPDANSAVDRLRARAEEFLDSLVERVQSVVREVAVSAAKLSAASVQSAIDKLGESVPLVPRVSRLVRLGLAKLRQAVETLKQLVGALPLDRLRETATTMWQRVTSGEILVPVIQPLLGYEQTRGMLTASLGARDLKIERVDAASAQIAQLDAQSAGATASLIRCTSGVSVAVTLAVAATHVIPVLAPWVAPVAAGAYVLIVVAAVLIAMDYADVGFVRRVTGLRAVLGSIGDA
jgi:hypothetical protein